jgi:hypothetical protein
VEPFSSRKTLPFVTYGEGWGGSPGSWRRCQKTSTWKGPAPSQEDYDQVFEPGRAKFPILLFPVQKPGDKEIFLVREKPGMLPKKRPAAAGERKVDFGEALQKERKPAL